MKIVQVTSYFHIRSRYQEYYLAAEYRKMGHTVSFVTSDRFIPFEDYKNTSKRFYGKRVIGTGITEEEGIAIYRLPVLCEFRSRVVMIGLKKTIRSLKPDIIIIHGIFTPHAMSLMFGKKLAPKIVIDDHMTYAQVDRSFFGRILYQLFRAAVTKELLTKADKIVAISEGCIKTMEKCYGIPGEQIEKIYLGVDPNVFRFDQKKRNSKRQELSIDVKTIVITFTGKVYKTRKIEIIIDALKKISTDRDIHLLIVGSIVSSYEEEFYDALSTLRIPYTIQPMAETTELVKYFCASDIVVYTLPTISTLEASACKRAIICSDETPERYKNNNGIGVKFGNISEMASALDKLIHDDKLRETMGNRGRSLIEKELSWTILANKMII